MGDSTRKTLARRRYRMFSDPGHGWLRVPMADVVALGIAAAVSGYSYSRGRFAYLEEDRDALMFIHAYRRETGKDPVIGETSGNTSSVIRRYASYTPPCDASARQPLVIFETRLARIGETPAAYSRAVTSTTIAREVVLELLAEYFVDRCDCEEFLIVTLNTRNYPTGIVRVTRGTLDASLVHPRDVFRPAIAAAAASILLVHNHPSGDPAPSREDKAVTDRLTDVGKTIGITVLDHIVVGDGKAVSIREGC